MKQVAINGFGRIGRNILRALLESPRDDYSIVAVNDLAPVETAALLLELDSTHGRLDRAVGFGDGFIEIDGRRIAYMSHRNPENCDWGGHGIELVMECTGIFTDAEAAGCHIDAGAARVLVSAPCKGADATIVYGVNDSILSPDMIIISNASCTTNCLAPVASVLQATCGINQGFMTTVHAYTGDQPTLDTSHKDLRRARAAAMSMIPTSTGAARSVGEVLPHLKGKMNGSAIRVPTANVSVVDFGFTAERDTGTDEINALLRAAAEGPMKGVLSVNDRPLVSVDFNHDPNSSIADLTQTHVMNNRLVRVLAWYDNEWGLSCRMLDNAAEIGKTL